ncbi:MMPL family transporter [Actinomadura fibrosa]|uniref:MMPL family transporter n=1 Tax=Actinomadura fibrosa TaxID=111802 RepID=A0ABW2Y147_9ACTN|nr:MMPL family transporter [Actinomadura fibrosa]
MAVRLYRLGRFAFRRRWLVALSWLGVLGWLIAGAMTLSGPSSSSFSIPGTEAQRAIDMLAERFPQAAAGGATARVVFAPSDGRPLTAPENKAAVEDVVRRLRTGPQVANVTDPFGAGAVNPARTVAYAQVTYRVPAVDLPDAAREALSRAVEPGRDAGLTVEMGGNAAEEPSGQSLKEIVGVAVAAVVLVVALGSVVAAGLPLLTAAIAIAVSMTAISTATGFVELSASTPTLAIMLGLAVSIDYALFIVFRYRHELHLGHGPDEATGRALGTAGSAVVFAGLTVVIALAGLSVVGIPVLTQMGLAAAAAVLVAVLIALTLVPALLGLVGERLRPAAVRTRGPRWARSVTGRPVPVLIAAALGTAVLATPALSLRLGLPDDSVAAPGTTQRKAYDMLADGFGAGFNGPLTVVVDAAGGTAPEDAAGGTAPEDAARGTDPKDAARRVAGTIAQLPGVAAVAPPVFNPSGDTALVTVVPRSAPGSAATAGLVTAIRGEASGIRAETGASIAVTGLTALDIDMSDKLAGALAPYLALVIGLAVVLLTLVFRSVLVPITATLGFLLSVAATFGAVVAVFQWGWLAGLFGVSQTAPVLSALPIFVIGVVFGLAMDYQVFLVTRIREAHVRGEDPVPAVVTGFGHSARVVTAAAVIMVAVFSGFMLSADPLVKSIGFALAAATLFDAFVIRMTIVPAVMTLLGRSAWWLPRWLGRALPDVDIEGRTLDRPSVAPMVAVEGRR